jgi:hypothetical protein
MVLGVMAVYAFAAILWWRIRGGGSVLPEKQVVTARTLIASEIRYGRLEVISLLEFLPYSPRVLVAFHDIAMVALCWGGLTFVRYGLMPGGREALDSTGHSWRW